ncbi:hypothetical protein ANN_17575 [Periplaneta americana]|uniref:Uncharacterized protein n=1 Tax=Periplaneta americana TaxID=6978 RepID=A0ABQ8SUN1_PERAM|nr:hypothetical protein ANN_17575 [Periplaneta americana]
MAGLCEGGNEPSGSLKAICNVSNCIGRSEKNQEDEEKKKEEKWEIEVEKEEEGEDDEGEDEGTMHDARTCKLVSKSETEVTGGQEGRTQARGTGNMCPGVELTDEGMYGLCLRVVNPEQLAVSCSVNDRRPQHRADPKQLRTTLDGGGDDQPGVT